MMQRRMMKLQSSGGMNGSGGGNIVPPSTSSQSCGPPGMSGWAQPPQSPHIGSQQQHSYSSSQMQQMGGISNIQQGIPSNIQQPHLRLNGPTEFHRMKRIFEYF
jgi:hypothetical protein